MKIFISSVQKEFAAERKALAKMIREDRWLGGFFDVFLFEECTAKAKTPQKVYLDAVAESDIYIGLIGNAYGNVDKDGVSPTEREYDKAAELGKDRLMFVKANDDNREDPERQFLGKVSGAVTWHSYDTAAKLSESVYDALYDWLRDNDLVTNKPFDLSTSRNVQLADLDKSRFEEYKVMVREAKKVRLGRENGLMDVLRKLQAVDKGNGRIVNGAIPLFAAHPEETRGSWEICCIQFYGTEQVKPLPSLHTYNGTVFELVDQALDFVLSRADYGVGNLKKGCATEGHEELPREAVREAIVNAVCHRDYASNACVQVMLFRDRLEVINPGCLPKGTTVDDLLISHDSNPRNHVIARAMSWTNYVEKSGSGTGEIIRLCREAGLADPVFESMTGHFKTIIWRRGYGKGLVKGLSARALCKGPSDRPKSLGPSRGAELKGPSRGGRVRGAESKEPSQFELVISLLAKCGDAMSASQIAKALNMHSVTGRLKKTFWTLLEDGIVERTERKINSRLQRYRLTDKGRSLAEKLLKKKGGGK